MAYLCFGTKIKPQEKYQKSSSVGNITTCNIRQWVNKFVIYNIPYNLKSNTAPVNDHSSNDDCQVLSKLCLLDCIWEPSKAEYYIDFASPQTNKKISVILLNDRRLGVNKIVEVMGSSHSGVDFKYSHRYENYIRKKWMPQIWRSIWRRSNAAGRIFAQFHNCGRNMD